MQHRSRLIVLAIAGSLALGGCSMFRPKNDYTMSQETRPLEVPPDLDSPSSSASMSVPNVAAGAGGDTSAAPLPIEAGEDSTLALTDSVGGAWKRIGLALERSGVAEIVARDEGSATYTVSGMSAAERKKERGFFKRMFSDDDAAAPTKVTRVVRVVASGAGSSVRVEDENGSPTSDDLSRRVITAIRQRLG